MESVDGASYLWLATALVVGGCLLLAGINHLLAVSDFRDTILRRPWADAVGGWVGVLAVGVAIGEVALGAAVMVAALVGTATSFLLALSSVVFVTFMADLILLKSSDPDTSCGCAFSREPVSWIAVVRAGALTIACVALVVLEPASFGSRSTALVGFAGLSAVAWTVALMHAELIAPPPSPEVGPV